MSFILDALRKSDARRQQGGPPGLNSPEPSPPPGRRRRGGWGVPVVAGLVVVAVAAGGIAVLRPQWLPQQLAGLIGDPPAEPMAGAAPREPAPDEVASQAESEASESLTAAEIRQRMTGRRAGNRPVRNQDADAGQARTVAEAEPAADGSPGDGASAGDTVEETAEPVAADRRQPRSASPERSVSRQAPQRETVPMPPEEGLEELERRLAQGQQQAERSASSGTARSDPAEGGPADQARRRNQDASQAESAGGAPSRPLSEGVSEYVRQWELPLAVRRNLPQLELNIHVFSPREEERFVLVNGERYVAGDSLGQGAQLVSIRREGAIVDFRSHRFLLEPR